MASLLLFPPVSFPLLVGWVLERGLSLEESSVSH